MSHDPLDHDLRGSGATDNQPSRSPTRRTLLTLLAAMPIVPADTPSSARTSGTDADPLPRLFGQFEAITAAYERALARIDCLEARLVTGVGHPRVRLPSPPNQPAQYAANSWSIDRARLPCRRARRLKRELRRCQQAWNAAALELGLTDAIQHEEQVARAVRAIGAVLLATPATSPRTVSLKLLVLLALHQPGPADAAASPWRELRLILADVASLPAEGHRG